MDTPSNDPFTTEVHAQAIETTIKNMYPQVTTAIRHDRFEPQHWYVDVKWEQHMQLVIRSEKSWEDRKHLFTK
jgi:hypothetical protein